MVTPETSPTFCVGASGATEVKQKNIDAARRKRDMERKKRGKKEKRGNRKTD
jgi:hypothetical protein